MQVVAHQPFQHRPFQQPLPTLPILPLDFLSRYTPLSKTMTSSISDLANLPFPHPRQFPTMSEIQCSRSIIETLDQDIEDLEQKIGRLQRRLQEVQQQRANYASYISPLRRLPTEILSKIVSLCINYGEDIIKMTRICTRLREVVHGMPGIWNSCPTHNQFPIMDLHGRYNRFYGSSFHVRYWLDKLVWF
jgi:hypothetical protein